MKKLILVCLLLLGAGYPQLPNPTNVRVHDGDTIKVDFAGVPELFGKDMLVRLSGVDTAELHDPNPVVKAYALKTQAYLNKRVANAKKLELVRPFKDKYFRVNATLLIDGTNIEKEMEDKGYSKPYNGGLKDPWTVKDVETMSKRN